MTHSHGTQQHQHHHTAVGDFDWAGMAEVLVGEAEAFQPFLDGAFADLADLEPERVLDIGSGPGVAACLLAQRFPRAEVVAVDGTPELLEHARRRAQRLGVRLLTRQGNFPAALADLPEADLIWTSHVMHHVGDQVGALAALAARLRPGGVLAVAEGGLPRRTLPRDIGFGRPGLQVRLDALVGERFERMRAELPGSVAVVEDWPEMLRTAGLIDAHSRSYLVDRPAPLTGTPRHWVRQDLQRHRDSLGDLLEADDLAALDRLLDPADPAGVDQRPDVYLLTAKTVHFARRPEN
ncbi:trans-aconitate 2-methyltransferase [Nocardia sp. BMG111209]|uniref:class I SAM-dependent methyltransferase n=1 Tax=Nocardia sp. BMG111209 TaxID=1160137 RepID=UPI00035CEE1B|nr:class I SAM-dependent methyltransferase [Nocardia sp. BMG111209]